MAKTPGNEVGRERVRSNLTLMLFQRNVERVKKLGVVDGEVGVAQVWFDLKSLKS